MRLASGTIVSLVITFGALLIFIAVDSSTNIINNGMRQPKTRFLRPSSSSSSLSSKRKLYNYYSSNNNNNNAASSSSSNSGYDTSSNYMNANYANGDGTYGGTYGGNDGQQQQQEQYGNNYANYQDNGYNNNENYQNQNYDNYNNWQDDTYKSDDASYYNQNSNYQSNGSNYNGRGQSWGGDSVQGYTDDEEAVVIEEGQYEDDEQWNVFGKIDGLSAKETVAVSVLAAVVSISMVFLMLLASGHNMVDYFGMYCCCGLFGHVDQASTPTETETETIEDGFVKLGNN